MERVRISSYARQRSAMGGNSSPMHVRGGGHVRSGSAGPSNFRRPQQARAAAQRLARVMAHQPAEDDDGSDTDRDHDDGDDEDDDDFYQPPSARVARRSRSPAKEVPSDGVQDRVEWKPNLKEGFSVRQGGGDLLKEVCWS
ncbi:hypothetical protein QJS04_geneDACA003317 [Acorus gramineus]|uniref:Uncharacterized protein n=1 Tax=Acorus gramineus TaxID=55184 RepID=A0AAV9BQY8_ACOGR|nr:hypothetical protein QJS04_geneDACA003317 [Acorus gramineus]